MCALFLASCSTTGDPVTQLGLASTALQSDAATSDFKSSDGDLIASAPGADDAISGSAVPLPVARPATEETTAPVAESGTETAAAPEKSESEVASTEDKPENASPETDEAVTEASKPPSENETSSDSAEEAVASGEATSEEETTAKRQNFLSAFFSAREPKAVQAAEKATRPLIDSSTKEKPKVILASASEDTKPVQASANMGSTLPGVRQGESLFEFSSKSGSSDADADIYEEEPAYQVASAAGMARLAPNGLLKQRESVDTACLKPALVGVLKTIERHYGKRIVVTSGYRSPNYNRRVRGARKSLHMYCAAADIQIEGVSKWELAKYVRSMPGRGGVGTYCHTKSVHVDIGPERDWNWRCRRRK
ncbi:D-Ala-D-Ala carboxypeptidase family metallohydrolase [uncultured Nitratireductor sp.]|uniref:YcbK family protein n=1 Tax=uncultured Nitratireductor sp. TaxID=520953 RepID=UPI0025DECAC8|nr:D-Ala-D-Ala carboxypeptidase family metallohydrolase [uncultured Nitratireductor sp.]